MHVAETLMKKQKAKAVEEPSIQVVNQYSDFPMISAADATTAAAAAATTATTSKATTASVVRPNRKSYNPCAQKSVQYPLPPKGLF